MSEGSDWRLQGQEAYLKGVRVVRRAYRRPADNPTWDHDHCEFCGVKFMEGGVGDTLHEGYATLDGRRWVCAPCFDDFRVSFQWVVVGGDPEVR